MTKLTELKYKLLPHPAYSPDLALCNYYLSPKMEKWLAGKDLTQMKRWLPKQTRILKS